jgi:hypothetical protein
MRDVRMQEKYPAKQAFFLDIAKKTSKKLILEVK